MQLLVKHDIESFPEEGLWYSEKLHVYLSPLRWGFGISVLIAMLVIA